VDDDRLDGQLAAGALDAQRDLAAVGDQYLVEQLSGGFGCHERGEWAATRGPPDLRQRESGAGSVDVSR